MISPYRCINHKRASWNSSHHHGHYSTRFMARKSVATISSPVATQHPSIVIGAGPIGLLTAVMLAQRGMKGIQVLERLPPPPAPDDLSVWGDFETTSDRLYLIGLNGRGQKTLKALGVWEFIEPFCSSVTGRMDFNSKKNPLIGRKTSYTTRSYTTKCLQRDRLAAALLRVVQEKYSDSVQVDFGVEVTSCEWTIDVETGKEAVKLGLKGVSNDGEELLVTSPIVIGADGTASTIRRAMEEDTEHPEPKFNVARFKNTNEFKYRTIPIHWPKELVDSGERPLDLNYSVRHEPSDINMDCLPTREGPLIGVVLYRPGCQEIANLKTGSDAKELFARIFPAFLPALKDDDLARFAAKSDCSLPSFSYAGPRLNRGGTTCLVGDSIHTVKPYFGQGVNSGFEDVAILKAALDETSNLSDGLKRYSDLRAKDAEALVVLSRTLDGGFFSFVLPLIIDSIFNKLLPSVFSPNIISNFMNERLSFAQIRTMKRKERVAQSAIILGFLSVTILAIGKIFKQILSLFLTSKPI